MSYASQSSRRPRSFGRRFRRRQRVCQFCADPAVQIDYKKTDLLKRYITDSGKIRGRRQTGTCARHQRMVARSIKRARHIAMLPYTSDRFR